MLLTILFVATLTPPPTNPPIAPPTAPPINSFHNLLGLNTPLPSSAIEYQAIVGAYTAFAISCPAIPCVTSSSPSSLNELPIPLSQSLIVPLFSGIFSIPPPSSIIEFVKPVPSSAIRACVSSAPLAMASLYALPPSRINVQ